MIPDVYVQAIEAIDHIPGRFAPTSD
ncbi:uncharacterized protein METZ01_LOCUS153983 [marine metagenome]|uniref:Uncharacterized protein n=1 Tax=marine metagenome TaxID=408172 RepID=A0A382AIE2_9ZZZZ